MLYSIHSIQKLPVSLEGAWIFFSDPKNLNTITPENMNFKTISGDEKNMFEGQIIQYKISPFRFITMEWVTEITHVKPFVFFVDEQRFGPYKFWHHKHFFTKTDDGVLMEDLVHYKLPFGIFGRLFHSVLVKPKLDEIFAFRKQKLIELFGSCHE